MRMAMLVVLLTGLCGPHLLSAADEKPLIEADFVKLEDLPDAIWAADKVDDKDCRILKGGVAGVVPLPAWWGEGLRPKEPTAFNIAVTYKDEATAPIRVEIYSGLPGRSEIHRIGGLNDHAWKTALIPVAWDTVMRNSAKGTELVFTAPARSEIAFQHIAVVPGHPAEDEARWSTETRDWTARVQAEALKTAKLPDAETAVIPDTLKEKQIVPFTRIYTKLIYPTSAPQEKETGAGVTIKMARNEIEPAQFGVYANGADLKNVRVTFGKDGLQTVNGEKLKCELALLTGEYAVTRGGVFPQRLWPAFAVDIPKGKSHLFWINAGDDHTLPKAGIYAGKILIEAEGLPPEELPLSVDVSDIKLLTMKEAELHLGGCVTGLLPAHELRALVKNNHNSINIWASGVSPRIMKKSATDFDLDFALMDDFMRHAKEAGVDNFVYFLGGDPYGFPDTLSLERDLYRSVCYSGTNLMDGRKEFIRKQVAAPDRVLPELRPVYIEWVKKVMAHAKEAHWPEPILTPFDEPAKWSQGDHAKAKLFYYIDQKTHSDRLPHIKLQDVEKFLESEKANGNSPEELGVGGAAEWIKGHFKDACAAIHEASPGVRVYGSIHHAGPGIIFADDVDLFCTNAIHEDAHLGDKVRAAGPNKWFWQYSGCSDASPPGDARYTFGFYFGAFNSRGSLVWAYNWGARFDTTQGDNWEYAWTTPYSIVRAPYFEGMREGWDDRRYIETLKQAAHKKGKDQEAHELLEQLFNSAVKSRTEGGRDTVNDFWARSKDPEALDAMRAKIRDMIVSLTRN
jgi:hypothetical protein